MTLTHRPAAVAAVLSLALLLLYLAFPTKVYYWDGITFAQSIEDAGRLNASLAHPNHLVYNFAGYLFYRLLRGFGIELRALTALQILNSLVSAACAAALFVILKDVLRSVYLAVCLTLMFALSATWWKFSTDANAYVPSVFFLLVSFYLVLPERKPAPLPLALTFFASMCFHQLAVIAFPALAAGIYLQDRSLSPRTRGLNVTKFSFTAFLLIVVTYAVLFYLATGTFGVAQFSRWTVSYSPDAQTQFNFWSNLGYSLRGEVRLFFGGRFNLLKGLVNPAIVVLLVLFGLTVLLLLFAAARNLMTLKHRLKAFHLDSRQKTVLLLAIVWMGAYLIFLFFWLPQNTFYRLFYLPALIVALGLALSAFKTTDFVAALFVISVGLANFLFMIYPFAHVEKYPPLVFAFQLNREWPAGTVVYYGAANSDASLVRYFTPGTNWKLLRDQFPEESGAWLETTAIERLSATREGARWLDTHADANSVRELNDGAYRIRFIRIWFARDAQTRNAERQIHVTQDRTLCSEQRTKNSIQRRHVDRIFRRRFYAGQAHQFSHQQDGREEGDVRVSRALDLETCLLEHATQLGQTIPPPVIADFVLQAPQKHERRHK